MKLADINPGQEYAIKRELPAIKSVIHEGRKSESFPAVHLTVKMEAVKRVGREYLFREFVGGRVVDHLLRYDKIICTWETWLNPPHGKRRLANGRLVPCVEGERDYRDGRVEVDA